MVAGINDIPAKAQALPGEGASALASCSWHPQAIRVNAMCTNLTAIVQQHLALQHAANTLSADCSRHH